MEQNLPGKALVDRFLDPRFPDGKDCRSSDLGQEFLRRRPQHLFFVDLVSAILHHHRCPLLVTSAVVCCAVLSTDDVQPPPLSTNLQALTHQGQPLSTGHWAATGNTYFYPHKPPDGRLTKIGQNGTRVDNQTLHIHSEFVRYLDNKSHIGHETNKVHSN